MYCSMSFSFRSFPDLELVGDTSLMSILRWSFKNNMEKTMCASDGGQITLVGHSTQKQSAPHDNLFRIIFM